jgi:hypothetical protein
LHTDLLDIFDAAWLSWLRVGLLYGRPGFDSRLGTTGRVFPLSLQSDEEMERGPGK